MENLHELLFELSNEDRYRILLQLDMKAMTVTSLSKTLDLSKQEVSRHVSRLSNADLTQKRSNGSYCLTHYGKLALKQLDGPRFTSTHREYFYSHSIAHLPNEFVYRIGELSHSKYVKEVVSFFYNVEEMMPEADKYIWTITDQYPMSTQTLFDQALERGISVRNLEVKDMIVPPELLEKWLSSENIYISKEARSRGTLKERMLDSLGISLFMSEKEIAVIAFPTTEGKFDYLGFTSRDERAHKWCKDLFLYYWERAEPRESVIEELCKRVMKRPETFQILEGITKGEEILNGEELISKLENISLIKQGRLTALGEYVYRRLVN